MAALNLINNDETLGYAVAELGKHQYVSDPLFALQKQFTCRMYVADTSVTEVMGSGSNGSEPGKVTLNQVCCHQVKTASTCMHYQSPIWHR